MINLNYNAKIIEIEKLCTVYEKYKLSLLGKIAFVLILLHLLTVLPFPGQKIFQRLQNMFNYFMWGHNIRISQDQLQRDILEGGLKLPNLTHFHNALKLSWIKRLIESEGDWQILFECVFKIQKKK